MKMKYFQSNGANRWRHLMFYVYNKSIKRAFTYSVHFIALCSQQNKCWFKFRLWICCKSWFNLIVGNGRTRFCPRICAKICVLQNSSQNKFCHRNIHSPPWIMNMDLWMEMHSLRFWRCRIKCAKSSETDPISVPPTPPILWL